MKKYALPCLVMALLLGMITLGPQLNAQTNTAEPSASGQQGPPPAAGAADQQAAKAFSGTIAKDGDKLVLKDVANNMTYQLDDQKAAKKYEGKTVTVTGSLDPSSNTIHVEKIKVAS